VIVQRRIRDSPHHPVQPEIVHWKESAIEEDGARIEMNFSPSLVHHAAKHFWEPEVIAPNTPKRLPPNNT
jgi:hypothetical protein